MFDTDHALLSVVNPHFKDLNKVTIISIQHAFTIQLIKEWQFHSFKDTCFLAVVKYKHDNVFYFGITIVIHNWTDIE